MSFLNQKHIKPGALAGIAGGAAFLLAMKAEIRMSGRNLNDILLLGTPISRNPHLAKTAGLVAHTINSGVLGVAYTQVFHDRLPGPPAIRGAAFAVIENSLLYPLLVFESRHPGIRDGQIDSYWSIRSYLWTTPRHIAYGAVVAVVYERLRSHNSTTGASQ
ncbi:hypothetical protein BH23CHL5_BH23CHL5_00250 [soil metagenome]